MASRNRFSCRAIGRQGQFAMKRKVTQPAARKEIWVARGSPEYEAWTAKARADGQSIPEYRSAIMGTVGFWRRSKFPPGHAADAPHSRASPAHRRAP